MAQWLAEYVAQLERAGLSVQAKTTAFGAHRLRGKLDGTAFEYRIGASGPPKLFATRLSIESAAPGEFLVIEEHPGCSLARGLGMIEGFKSGDRKLDEEWYFAGSTDQYAREVFGSPGNLDCVRALLAEGFSSLRKRGSRISAPRSAGALLPPAKLKKSLALLAGLKLPQNAPDRAGRAFADRIALTLLCAALVAMPLISIWGIGGLKPVAGGWMQFWFFSLPYTVLLCGLLLGVAYLVFRGRPMVAPMAVGWVVFFYPLLALLGFGAIAVVNERFDFSAAQTHEVREVRRHTFQTRRNASDELVLESWRGPDTESLTLNGFHSGGFGSSPSGLWRVRVRRGLLGFQWVEAIDPVKKGAR